MLHKVPEDSTSFYYNEECLFPGTSFFQGSFPGFKRIYWQIRVLSGEETRTPDAKCCCWRDSHQSSQKIQRHTPVLELYPTHPSDDQNAQVHLYSLRMNMYTLDHFSELLIPRLIRLCCNFFSANALLSWINLIIVCAPIQFQGFPTVTAYSVSLLRCSQEWISIFPSMILRLCF